MKEGPHHIFVKCTRFLEWRETARQNTTRQIARVMENSKTFSGGETSHINEDAENIFKDEAMIWPMTESQYYLEHVSSLARDNHGKLNNRKGPKARSKWTQIHTTSRGG